MLFRSTVDEALAKDGVYSAPLKATFRILHREESGKVKQIAEQDADAGVRRQAREALESLSASAFARQ